MIMKSVRTKDVLLSPKILCLAANLKSYERNIKSLGRQKKMIFTHFLNKKYRTTK